MKTSRFFDDEENNYDAILIVSFGGPEGPDDVMPFLDNVLMGLNVPKPVKVRIAKRYQRFGGISPINRETRSFIQALEIEIQNNGPQLPIYWGNRNWHPMLPDTLNRMADDGIKNAIAYVTSTFSSYSGCRKYREDLYEATQGVDNPPHIDKLRVGYNHPGFIKAVSDRTREALESTSVDKEEVVLMFTAHSLPLSMAKCTDYEAQLQEACNLVGQVVGINSWQLVYQSNNASYGEPWLEPDIADALEKVKSSGRSHVVIMPIGFVCDHMEVVLDLDIEAKEQADNLGLQLTRAATVGSHPAYISMVRELIIERMSKNPDRQYLGSRGANGDYCKPDCCLSGRPGNPKPTLCGIGS
ncbi:MAG: ferrochelatase [Candidatus Rariloculaceae bacterium]